MPKDLLIDGYVSFELIWGDKNVNIIDIKRLPSDRLTPCYEQSIGSFWIENANIDNKRILLSSQVLIISWDFHGGNDISYVETLMKAYDQMHIAEEITLSNSILKRIININTNNLSKQRTTELQTRIEEVIGKSQTISIDGIEQEIISHNILMLDPNFEFSTYTELYSNIPLLDLNYFKNKFDDATLLYNDVLYNDLVKEFKRMFKQIIEKPFLLQIKNKYPDYNIGKINVLFGR